MEDLLEAYGLPEIKPKRDLGGRIASNLLKFSRHIDPDGRLLGNRRILSSHTQAARDQNQHQYELEKEVHA